VGVCVWLAKFLRMSRPDLAVGRHAHPADVGSSRRATPRPAPNTRRHASTSNKKSSSSLSSKSAELFHRQSSRSLLANVLDLEDNFLLLNLAPGARTTTQCASVPHAPASVELPSLQAPLSPAKDIPLLPDFLSSLFSVAHCLPGPVVS